jgi:hypothetical protein
MSVDYSFLSNDIHTIEEVENICLKFSDVTREDIVATVSDSLQILDLEYEKLPENFLELSEMKLNSISVNGFNSASTDMVTTYIEILNKASSDLVLRKYLDLSVYFEEKESSQTADACDRVFIRNLDGRYFFCYTINGSKAVVDVSYRLALFKKIIDLINLPIEVEDNNEFFSLKHSSGAELNVGGPFSVRNPKQFFCELPNLVVDEAVISVKKFLNEFSSGKIFSHEWYMSRSTSDFDGDVSNDAKELYNAIIDNKLTAEKYFINLSFYLTSLMALENARKWCTEKGSIYSTLCYFKSEDGAAGQFSVIGTQEGYKIELTFDQPLDIQKVEELLHIRFQEIE